MNKHALLDEKFVLKNLLVIGFSIEKYHSSSIFAFYGCRKTAGGMRDSENEEKIEKVKGGSLLKDYPR